MTQMIILESQHPDAVLDYAISYATWLEEGDALSSTNVTVSTAGLTLGDGSPHPAPAIVGETVVFWLSGGVSGETYFGEIEVVATSGRTDKSEWQITIIDPNA